MLRGDRTGRVPFALVAVFLLLSAGMSAMYAAKLGRDEADARLREARVAAMNAVADDVHREVLAQAQFVALGAIAQATDGLLNETRASLAFRAGFADYLASHFPRVVRGVSVGASVDDADLGFAQRRMDDAVPSNATRVERVDNVAIETPDLAAPDVLAPVDRLAYVDVHGSLNYTLALDGMTLRRLASLDTLVPVPAPLMETKLEQTTRSGEGDLTGVGRTVKAILATLVQVRVLDGMASPVRPGTTTGDVLTSSDVELAVNVALLLEEIRRFRAYDRDAARAIDATHPPPTVPTGILPPSADRTLVRLLDRYAANGTLDATDLYALYVGLDGRGLSLASLLAQAIAAIQDELSLKGIDYLGLTPLADWVNGAAETVSNWVDGFWSWLTDQPDARARYVRQFVGTIFLDTGIGTGFYGPLAFPIPARAYAVPNGTRPIAISIPAHDAAVPFPSLDLFNGLFNQIWDQYFPELHARVGVVDASLRAMVNDVASSIANDAVLSGLLPESASGAIDPKDNVSFLDTLSARVSAAIDVGLARLRSDPHAIESLMGNLWNATKSLLEGLVDFLVRSYDAIAAIVLAFTGFSPAATIRSDLESRAALDPRYAGFNATQRDALRVAIANDVNANGWDSAAREARKANDTAKWRLALALADGASQPGAHLRGQILMAVLGSSGWLVAAGDTVKRLLSEAVAGQDLEATRAIYRTSLDEFTLTDPWTGAPSATERFRVRQSPPCVRVAPGLPAGTPEGELHVWIVDPADVAGDDGTPNVHYTNPFAPSRRPFTTQWTVLVSGSVRLRVETASPVLLGPDGLEPAGFEKLWPIEFAVPLPAYSGWSLARVRYRPSNTLLADIVGFLERAFAALLPVLRWVFDILRKGLEILRDFVARVFDFVTKVVRVLADLFSRLVDVLRAMALQTISLLGQLLDASETLLPWGVHIPLHVGGIGLDVLVKGDRGRRLVLGFDLFGHGEIAFIRVDESEFRAHNPTGATYDVLGTWDAAVGPLSSHARFDPIPLAQVHMVDGNASWARAWSATFDGPEVESALVFGPSVGFSAILPTGTEIGGKVGIQVLVPAAPAFDLGGVCRRIIDDAMAQVGTIHSLRDVGRIVRTMASALKTEVLDLIEANVLEVAVFAEVTVSEVGAGGGVRLSLLADGRAVRLLLDWIAANAVAYFDRGPNPFAATDFHPPPLEILEHAWVKVEGFFAIAAPEFLASFGVEGSIHVAACVEPNLSAIGHLVGRAWGRAEVRFGLLVEAEGRVGWIGSRNVLYILRGSVVFP